MGNQKSRPLKLNIFQHSAANEGKLFATFSDVWEDDGELAECTGSFKIIADLRRGEGNAPDDLRKFFVA